MLALILGTILFVQITVIIYLYRKHMRTREKLLSVQSQFETDHGEKLSTLERNCQILEAELQMRKELEYELNRLATIDSLTGLYNRRKIEKVLEYEVDRNRRHPLGLSLILIDLDYFKRINDRWGHDTGDAVLSDFATLLRECIRKTDIPARWGGEEFMVILPGIKPEAAWLVAEKIRRRIERTRFPRIGKLTVSMGVCLMDEHDDAHSLVKRADIALYDAKRKGRNNVQIAA